MKHCTLLAAGASMLLGALAARAEIKILADHNDNADTSPAFKAPTNFSIIFSKDMRGVAATSGTRIRCAASWIRRNLQGEAVGAVFHEMVHVVQQYGRTRRAPGATRPRFWT